MRKVYNPLSLAGFLIIGSVSLTAGCGGPAINVNTASNTNINSSTNAAASTNFNSSATSSSTVTASEPEQYQANVKLSLQALGDTQTTTMPSLGAVVGRSGADRVMEFAMPGGEKIIYLDKGGMNYLILPNRKQYAELTKEAVGFEVRRFLMPEQIVQHVKAIPGMKLVGEETQNGRTIVKYAYSAAANTQTQAGTVSTESFVLIDKATGLPIRSETVSQSQSGGNVQGYKGLRIVTEMTDIETTPDASKFTLPTDYQKIDSEQVKAQATAIFQVVGQILGNMIQQSTQPAPAGSPASSPATSPVR